MALAGIQLGNRAVAARFDQAAAAYDHISNRYTTWRRAVAVAREARGLCLEVGGGTGAVIEQLGGRVRGIHSDIAPRMCRIAAGKLGCPSVCFDAESIPLADGSVDTVVSAEMIYYLNRRDRFLREAYRVLQPGGRLLLSTTNPTIAFLERLRTLLRRMRIRRMFFDDGSPEFPAVSLLIGELERAGFGVLHVRPVVLLPFAVFDRVNRLLERTPLRRFALFITLAARKPSV